MNLKAFKNNITDCVNTTAGLYNAIKKLFWLYNGMGRLGYRGVRKTQIAFKFPPPIGNISLKVRNNHGSDSFIMSEVFQDQCYFLSPNNDFINILDLGANAGFTAVYFSRIYKNAKIACVEPMPGNISILKENLKLNNVDSFVFEAAAAVRNEKIMMETGDKDYAGKVHHIPFGKVMNNETLVVDGLTITSMIEKLNWNKIDLLKIDIEGYEGILLNENNNWLAKVDTIIMEIHEGVTIDFIKKAVEPYNFINVKLQKGNWVLSKKEIY